MSVVKEFPVEKEYEKNPDISPRDIRKLREWLTTQPHLPGDYLTELDLLLVFYCCEKSAEVSKQVLDLHFTLRTLLTAFSQDRQLDKKTELCLNTVLYAPLPTPIVHGHRAIYLRLLDPDPRRFNYVGAVRTFMMVFDLWQYEEGTWPGFVIIIDMELVALAHLAKVDLTSLRQVLYFLQECMLVKLKAVHFMNAPVFMDRVMMLLKPFLKKLLLDTIHVHQTGSHSLHDHVPLSALPREAGGEYKDHSTIRDELIARLRKNQQFFVQEARRRVVEAHRPGERPATVETLFGIQGSFKKLDID